MPSSQMADDGGSPGNPSWITGYTHCGRSSLGQGTLTRASSIAPMTPRPRPITLRYNYRCNKSDCRQRQTLAHLYEWYHWKRRPKCKGCGRRDTLWCDPEPGLRHRREMCNCGGVRFPHRRTTFLSANEFCKHADVVMIGDSVSYVYKVKPGEVCPF